MIKQIKLGASIISLAGLVLIGSESIGKSPITYEPTQTYDPIELGENKCADYCFEIEEGCLRWAEDDYNKCVKDKKNYEGDCRNERWKKIEWCQKELKKCMREKCGLPW